jgi:diphthamide synthase (EF-2-diphthine--ammonia ligase)
MKERVVMSWSGGKDSAMALQELLRAGAYEVVSLLTTVSEEYRRISHHGVRESLLDDRRARSAFRFVKSICRQGTAVAPTKSMNRS